VVAAFREAQALGAMGELDDETRGRLRKVLRVLTDADGPGDHRSPALAAKGDHVHDHHPSLRLGAWLDPGKACS
jgi:hypothetical protein